MGKKAEELWVTNISREKDVSVGDLRLTIRRGQSLNLLAKSQRGKALYNFTREQLDASIMSGSIYNKRDVLKVRQIAPVVFNHRVDIAQTVDRAATRLKRKASEIEIPDFPDLDFEDEGSIEDFAAENADVDFQDRAPALAVDPKYKKPTVDDE